VESIGVFICVSFVVFDCCRTDFRQSGRGASASVLFSRKHLGLLQMLSNPWGEVRTLDKSPRRLMQYRDGPADEGTCGTAAVTTRNETSEPPPKEEEYDRDK
jgi:hypothetical protein